MVAAVYGQPDPLALLLEAGADPHQTNVNQGNALQLMREHGSLAPPPAPPPQHNRCEEILLAALALAAALQTDIDRVGGEVASGEGATVYREGRLELAGSPTSWFDKGWEELLFRLKSDGEVEYHKESFHKGKTILQARGGGHLVAARPGGGGRSGGKFGLLLTLGDRSGRETVELTLRTKDASRVIDWMEAFNRFAPRR